MMSRAFFLALLVASPIAGFATEAAQNAQSIAGVQKVIQMLGDMQAKSKEEKNKEQVAFAEFETWCKMEIPQTKKSIAKAGETIESLTAAISKLTAEAKVLGQEIAKLEEDVASFESEKKKADAQREKDNKAFIEESTDYGESVDAIERAITVLMKKTADKPAADAVLLQLADSDRLPAKAQSMIAAFIGVMGKDGDS
jgi:predicted RNase H-like nuclease (RuvC/YqgF family)